jgi:TonB family protein
MRDQLHLMELVDRYLDGGMGVAEHAAFEERMGANAELRALVDDQRALREGLHRVQLRHALASAHRNWSITRWVPWLVAGLFVMVAGAWLVGLPLEHDARTEAPHGADVGVPETREPTFATRDSLVEPLDLDTRVETMFTHTPSKTGRWADTSRGEGRIVTHLITQEEARIDEPTPVSAQVEPAEMPGSVSRTSAEFPVAVGLQYRPGHEFSADSIIPSDVEPDAEKTVLATVERFENATKPEFPGGMEEMQRFIQENLKQPRGTKKSGTVTVGFTVNKKGEVVSVEVVRSLGRAFDAEAVRVITCMPKWEPSRLGDRPVKSKLEVHVRFEGAPRKGTVKERRR